MIRTPLIAFGHAAPDLVENENERWRFRSLVEFLSGQLLKANCRVEEFWCRSPYTRLYTPTFWPDACLILCDYPDRRTYQCALEQGRAVPVFVYGRETLDASSICLFPNEKVEFRLYNPGNYALIPRRVVSALKDAQWMSSFGSE